MLWPFGTTTYWRNIMKFVVQLTPESLMLPSQNIRGCYHLTLQPSQNRAFRMLLSHLRGFLNQPMDRHSIHMHVGDGLVPSVSTIWTLGPQQWWYYASCAACDHSYMTQPLCSKWFFGACEWIWHMGHHTSMWPSLNALNDDKRTGCIYLAGDNYERVNDHLPL